MASGVWTKEILKDDLIDMSAFETPETKLIKMACKIQDMFLIPDNEDENIKDEPMPTLKQLIPLATRFAQAVIDNGATDATLNVANSILSWIDKPRQQGRAWNIKMAAKQLADLVAECPNLDKPIEDDGLPF